MQRLAKILYWQLAFFAAAIIILVGIGGQARVTGMAVSQSDETDQFAPPYDAFTGESIIMLSKEQVDNTTFRVDVSISASDSAVYHNLYYYTTSDWQQVAMEGDEWMMDSAQASIEDFYAAIPEREGDDFFVGVWVCKGVDGTWQCGCKTPSDCGHWHVQGIDLTVPEVTCTDEDGDGYGVDGQEACFMPETDCDDSNASINPGESEVMYNGVDDDCDPLTKDDDVDGDGILSRDDCDDTNSSINPLAEEICGDGIDQDCSGVDEPCADCSGSIIPSTGCTCGGTDLYDGYCCDDSFQETPCMVAGALFSDDFESASTDAWEYFNPYSKVNDELPRTGSYGADFIYSSSRPNQYASTSLADEQRVFYRYYVLFEEDFIHPVQGGELLTIAGDGWEVREEVRRWQGQTSKGMLSLIVDGTNHDTGQEVEAGQWYCLELEVLADDQGFSNGAVRLWMDDMMVLELEGESFADGEYVDSLVQGGKYKDSLSSSIHLYVDDIIVDDERVGC